MNNEVNIIANFDVDEKNYVAILEKNEAQDNQIFLYQYLQINEDEIELVEIESDSDYLMALEKFKTLTDN